MQKKSENQSESKLSPIKLLNGTEDPRTKLAFLVTLFSIITVGIISLTILVGSVFGADLEGAQLVLTGILPLLGTWVGTILAYYFSKDNFETAAASERKRLSIQQKRIPVPALTVSRKLGKMVVARMPKSNVILAPDKGPFVEFNVQRLPVLDKNDHPHYIIHLNTVIKFRETAKLDPKALTSLTLETLGTKDPQILSMFEKSFTTISPDSSISEAKQALEGIPQCQDVFITKDGTRNSPILGWLTNTRILEQLGE